MVTTVESPHDEIERLKRELGRLRSQVVEAERSKTEYVQNVAHQLAAPINAIKMNIEAVNNPRVPFERKKELFRSIYSLGHTHREQKSSDALR